jgi:mevalonate kinase
MAQTPLSAASPAKFILFGEHAVVYGEPAIAVAIELPLTISVSPSQDFTVDGAPLDARAHSFIKGALELGWKGPPVALGTRSEIPRASGLGSSAAVVVATLAALKRFGGAAKIDEEELARTAFEVEYTVQGRASPTDTSVCTHGQAIMLAKDRKEGLLWHIKKEDKEWFIHHLNTPQMTFVIGNTNERSGTKEMVGKVRRYYEKSALARETIAEIGTITMDGAKALQKGDQVELGRLMTLNHKRLASLGASSPKLDKLVEACRPHSFGAKLTGKGGGGCMVALTDKPKDCCAAISKAGGVPLVVTPAMQGARFVD